MVAEEVFGFESNGGFDVPLKLNRSEAQCRGHFFNIKSVLFGEGEEINA